MATEKNIVMKEFNGTDYDTLYPKTIGTQVDGIFTAEQTLTNYTKMLYGLGTDAVPDDVFKILSVGAGKYGYSVTVLYPDGSPATGLSVAGATDVYGHSITTDENGFFMATSTENSIAITIYSKYFDITSVSQKLDSTGKITYFTITLPGKTYTDYVLIQISQTISFWKNMKIDLTAVGSGGGGGGGSGYSYGNSGGGGGGGGYVNTLLNFSCDADAKLSFTIPSGGSGGRGTSNRTTATDGNDGGDTIVSYENSEILRASGGRGGKGGAYFSSSTGASRASGGAGNGNGGSGGVYGQNPTNGAAGSGYIFNDSSLAVAGGGGGGGGGKPESTIIGNGGAPNGGAGSVPDSNGISYVAPGNGEIPGGGGGGGTGSSASKYGGTGGNGAIYIRWTEV